MNSVAKSKKKGLLFAMVTASLWGVLPIALIGILSTIDPFTATFFRFIIAATILTPLLIQKNKLINRHKLTNWKFLLQFGFAGLLLCINYALYIFGLDKTSAEAAQVMMQVAPICLLLAGVFLFKENFSYLQWFGVIIFVSGLLMFFSPKYDDVFLSFNRYGLGLILLLSAALVWVCYAIFQKVLLREFSAQETMMIFYWIGAVFFFPISSFDELPNLSTFQWSLILFCGLNTLIAYGSFSEALTHIDASRVSAILATTPLITLFFVQIVPTTILNPEPLNFIVILGALFVVTGSVITSTAKT